MITIQDLIDIGFPLDRPLILADPDQRGYAFMLDAAYDLTVMDKDDERVEYVMLEVDGQNLIGVVGLEPSEENKTAVTIKWAGLDAPTVMLSQGVPGAPGSGLELEVPFEITNYAHDEDKVPKWTVTGDLRLQPGWEDQANYDARDYLVTKGFENMDPESACFNSAPYATHDEAQKLYDVLLPWWAERACDAYCKRPEWFHREAADA